MRAIGQYLKVMTGFVLLFFIGYFFIQFYPYIFAKDIDGVLQKVERVELNVSLMQTTGDMNQRMNPQFFSFAVAIRTDDGEIMTASAEDRQWAAAQTGYCVTARFYPYPPWNFNKAGTYYNARLDRQYECPERSAKVSLPPVGPPHPTSPTPLKSSKFPPPPPIEPPPVVEPGQPAQPPPPPVEPRPGRPNTN